MSCLRAASSSVYVPMMLVSRNGRGFVERVVVVALGGVVHHRVVLAEELVDERRVRDVALDEAEAILGQAVEGGEVAGVGELVEHGDRVVGVRERVVDEVRADEAGAAGHEDSHGFRMSPDGDWGPIESTGPVPEQQRRSPRGRARLT